MKVYNIKNVDCEVCAQKIENHIKTKTNLETVNINLISSKLVINDTSLDSKHLTRLANQVESGVIISDSRDFEEEDNKKDYRLAMMLTSFGLLLIALIFQMPVFNLIGYLIVGLPVIILAFKNMRQRQFFDEYFLMTLATFAAIGIGEWSEALAVMLFYSVGEYIQDKTLDKTKMSITSLTKLGVRLANLVDGDKVLTTDIDQLQIGNIVRVASGEKVPVDCQIISGIGLFDTSHLSGEAEPQEIEKGNIVYGGSINCGDIIDLQVVATSDDSMIAKLTDLVTYADGKKTKTEAFITRFSKIYTPIVVALALLIVILFPPLFGITQSDAIYRAVTLLVISCPCAFVLSVPLGYVVAIGTLSKNHILVKGALAIDRLNKLTTLAVDKTGTVTTGDFEVVEFINSSNYDDRFINDLVASAEEHIVHPIASSLSKYAKGEKILKISELKVSSGHGINFSYNNKQYKLVKAETNSGYTVSNLYEDNKILATYKMQDTIKPGIKKFISDIRKRGIDVLMLTGDNRLVAHAVAEEVDLSKDKVYASLLPEDKLTIVEERINSGEVVSFIGDGLNDAAVIKRSDLGIAMGASGSELSIESSDVVISNDDITSVVYAIDVSQKANRIIKQNIGFAFFVKIIFIILGIIGITTMWEAVFSDVGVTLLAIINSMRIKRNKYDR